MRNGVNSEVDLFDEIASKGLAAVADQMTHKECVDLTLLFGTHNYHPLDLTIVKGEGAYVTDADGKEYIDCIGCYSALSLGHKPEPVIKALQTQLDRLVLTGRAVYTKELALYLQVLCQYTGTDMACPMNTGAEAVETAIKLARKWAYTVKGVPKDQAEIIVAQDNFHGRTTTIVGFSTEFAYRDGFGPATPGFKVVPFGDIEAVRRAIRPNTAAVLMEPIQAEGGMLVPPVGFMAELRRLCTDNKVLLIWDEIQTGFCRTGKRFAWQHEDAEPDLMCLGKALGGGVLPVAATVGKRDVMEVFLPGDHGSTFGGNPLAAAVACEAMAEMATNCYEKNAKAMGEYMLSLLADADHPSVDEVRGKGLLIGIEVRSETDAQKLQSAFLANGILTKETRHKTFRFAPPVNCDRELIEQIVKRILNSLHDVG
jgi:ornithine--oxo-acid transaminase